MSSPATPAKSNSNSASAPPKTFKASQHHSRAQLVTTTTALITFVLVVAGTALVIFGFLSDTPNGLTSSQEQNAQLSLSFARSSAQSATEQIKRLKDALDTETDGTGLTGEQATGLQARIVLDGLQQASNGSAQASEDVGRALEHASTISKERQEIAAAFDRQWLGYWIIYGACVIVVLSVAGAIISYSRQEARRRFENELLEDQATEGHLETDFSLLPLLRQNRSQLQNYHKIVRNYAESSRALAIITIGIGFAFILLVGLGSVFVDGTAGAISSSVIAASGAVLAGFIGQAVLRNTEASSRELISFFNHPIQSERILTAERLIASMPQEDKGTAIMLLVKHLAQTPDEDQTEADSVAP